MHRTRSPPAATPYPGTLRERGSSPGAQSSPKSPCRCRSGTLTATARDERHRRAARCSGRRRRRRTFSSIYRSRAWSRPRRAAAQRTTRLVKRTYSVFIHPIVTCENHSRSARRACRPRCRSRLQQLTHVGSHWKPGQTIVPTLACSHGARWQRGARRRRRGDGGGGGASHPLRRGSTPSARWRQYHRGGVPTAAPRTPIAPRRRGARQFSTGGATSAAPPSAVIVLASIARIRRHCRRRASRPRTAVPTRARHAAGLTVVVAGEIATADQRDASA